jgi:hypothetical protein
MDGWLVMAMLAWAAVVGLELGVGGGGVCFF